MHRHPDTFEPVEPDLQVPYLDTQMWMRKNDKCPMGEIMFTYFEKSMSSDKVIRKQSAINMRDTFTILTQEGIRRLRNVHPELPETVQNDVVTE